MRRTVLLAVALVAALAAPATAAKPRTVSADYVGPSVVATQQGDATALFGPRCGSSCVTVTVAKGERRARIRVQDRTGQATGWILSRGNRGTIGCGDQSFLASPGQTYYVATAAVPGCGPVTTGTLSVTLSR